MGPGVHLPLPHVEALSSPVILAVIIGRHFNDVIHIQVIAYLDASIEFFGCVK